MWAVRSPRSPSSADLIWAGVSSRACAAASSMASGRPSRKRHRSATSSAWSRSRKSGATASGPVDEHLDGRRSSDLVRRGALRRDLERRDRNLVLSAQTQRQPTRGQHGQAGGPIHQVVHQSAAVGDRLQVVQHDQDARVQARQRGLVIAPGHREGQLAGQLGLVRALGGGEVDDPPSKSSATAAAATAATWTFRSPPAPSASASGPVRRTADRGSGRRARDARTWGWRSAAAGQGHVAPRPAPSRSAGRSAARRRPPSDKAGRLRTTARPEQGPAAGSPPRAVAAPGPGRCRARRRADPAPWRTLPAPRPAGHTDRGRS